MPATCWTQVRLRTLLFGIALLAFCLAVALNGAHHERRVIAALRARGAFVSVKPIPTAWTVLEGLFGIRRCVWILKALGEGYLEEVDRVRVAPSHELAQAKSLSRRLQDNPQGTPGGDADLQLIGTLSRTSGLYEMELSCTHVSDGGLRHLVHFSNLERLLLLGTEIDGRGFFHLTGLTKLSWLDLDSTNVTDAGLEALPRAQLMFLFLKDTRITDAGIPHLSGLPLLIMLRLEGTVVTGRGFKGFVSGEKFRLDLSLAHCPVDDEGLREIVTVRRLKRLDLSHTRITDAGMEHLDELVPSDDSACTVYACCASITDGGLRRLRGAKGELYLHVGGTAVTQDGAAELTRRLPKYTVCMRCRECRKATQKGKAMGPISVATKNEKQTVPDAIRPPQPHREVSNRESDPAP